jgi:hypothetical protein
MPNLPACEDCEDDELVEDMQIDWPDRKTERHRRGGPRHSTRS